MVSFWHQHCSFGRSGPQMKKMHMDSFDKIMKECVFGLKKHQMVDAYLANDHFCTKLVISSDVISMFD